MGFVVGDRILGLSGDSHALWSAGYGVMGAWWVLAASAIGQSHLQEHKSRDDAVQVRAIGPWLAVGVADGVGTCPLSRYGASYVVDSLTGQLLRELAPPVQAEKCGPGAAQQASNWEELVSGLPQDTDQPLPISDSMYCAGAMAWGLKSSETAVAPIPSLNDVLSRAFQKTHLGLVEYARYLNLKPGDIGTTALALLMNIETGEGVVGQVGDGALLGLRADGNVEPLLDIEQAEDLQSVHSITSDNWASHFIKGQLTPFSADNPFSAFFVMSDGVSVDLLYAPLEKTREWANRVQRLVGRSSNPAQAATRILHSLATYKIPGSVDDRTLVIITRREQDANRKPSAGESELA